MSEDNCFSDEVDEDLCRFSRMRGPRERPTNWPRSTSEMRGYASQGLEPLSSEARARYIRPDVPPATKAPYAAGLIASSPQGMPASADAISHFRAYMTAGRPVSKVGVAYALRQ